MQFDLIFICQTLYIFYFQTVETDYQANYYVSDALLFLCCILTIWKLDVHVEEGKGHSLVESAKKMIYPAFILLGSMALWCGIVNAVSSLYVPVYLQNYLGASSDMIGKKGYGQIFFNKLDKKSKGR